MYDKTNPGKFLFNGRGATSNLQGEGGGWVFFIINNFGQTLHEINYLFQLYSI